MFSSVFLYNTEIDCLTSKTLTSFLILHENKQLLESVHSLHEQIQILLRIKRLKFSFRTP